jgi:predicted RNA-binding Zn-ribbon protein involved in translation (DUF1610 family)
MTRAAMRHRLRTCGVKVGFLSREAAVETARRLHPGKALDIYACPYCGRFHYGRRHTAKGAGKGAQR